MKFKLNISISLKITLIVVILSAIIILFLTHVTIETQESFLKDDYRERGKAIAKTLDASISLYNGLNNTDYLQKHIENITEITPELLQISVSRPNKNNNLYIFSSTNKSVIGKKSIKYNQESYNRTISEREESIYLIIYHSESSHQILIISPMNVSGNIQGTYEFLFSMDKAYETFDNHIRYLILMAFISFILLIFFSLILLRYTIVNPILRFRKDTKRIGKGNLDVKIDIKSHDELGDLADAFNQMTKDLKKSRNKIQRYSKTLEKLLKQKDEFIGQLGHDLKNPLTPLTGLLPMIYDREKDPNLKQHLKIIVHNVEYMRDLIFETLELARLRSSNIKFNIENLNLYDNLVLTIENQKSMLEEKNITVINNIDPKIFVKADKLRLVEVFNNLLSNSVKYTKEKNGKIIVDAKPDEEFVTISIKDNGIGMTKKQLERVFDEFYMADETRHKKDSTGLGLAICKRIVEKHGGKIWVDSPGLNKGTVFYFTLRKAEKDSINEKDN